MVSSLIPRSTLAQGQNPLAGLGLGGLPIPNLSQLFGGQGGQGLGGLGIPGNQGRQGLAGLTGGQGQGQPLAPLLGRIRGGTYCLLCLLFVSPNPKSKKSLPVPQSYL